MVLRLNKTWILIGKASTCGGYLCPQTAILRSVQTRIWQQPRSAGCNTRGFPMDQPVQTCGYSILVPCLKSGIPINFPNTSSNCYGSHCTAAAVLLQYHDKFLKFSEFVCDKKDHQVFTNMERNLYDALQYKPTLTELATLALYVQAIIHPYMWVKYWDYQHVGLGWAHYILKLNSTLTK